MILDNLMAGALEIINPRYPRIVFLKTYNGHEMIYIFDE
jgi:hypothetical protein